MYVQTQSAASEGAGHSRETFKHSAQCSAVMELHCAAGNTLLYNSAQAYRRGGGRDIPEAVARPDACRTSLCALY